MFGLPSNFDEELTTKHGFDKVTIMCKFIQIIEAENVEYEFIKFKAYFTSMLKRPISDQENLNLLKAIQKYIKSNGETPERLEAIEYISNAEFIGEN